MVWKKTTLPTNIASTIAGHHKDKSVFLLINLNGQYIISISFGYWLKKFILSIIKSEKQLQEVISHNIRNSNNEVIENLSIIYLEPNMRAFDHIINENSKIKDNLIKLIKYLDSQFVKKKSVKKYSLLNLFIINIIQYCFFVEDKNIFIILIKK